MTEASRSAGDQKRSLWRLLGLVSLLIAVAGMLLPLVPATGFLILGAYSLVRGVEPLHR